MIKWWAWICVTWIDYTGGVLGKCSGGKGKHTELRCVTQHQRRHWRCYRTYDTYGLMFILVENIFVATSCREWQVYCLINPLVFWFYNWHRIYHEDWWVLVRVFYKLEVPYRIKGGASRSVAYWRTLFSWLKRPWWPTLAFWMTMFVKSNIWQINIYFESWG